MMGTANTHGFGEEFRAHQSGSSGLAQVGPGEREGEGTI